MSGPDEPPWAPMSRRGGDQVEEPALQEGVPAHLDLPLRRWLARVLKQGGHAERIGLRLQLAFNDFKQGRPDTPTSMQQILVSRTDAQTLLDTVDAALYLHPIWDRTDSPWEPQGWAQDTVDAFLDTVSQLQRILVDASSAYRVADDMRGLEQRVDATATTATTATRQIAEQAGRSDAARDLADAWAKTYGLHPNPSEGYRKAVRAVEHAAVPVVLPRDRDATLTKVRNHLRDAPGKWRLAMGGDVEPLVRMLTLLTAGQVDRHGGQPAVPPVDQAAAEMAVHLATTLVQWFTAGHVQRVIGQA